LYENPKSLIRFVYAVSDQTKTFLKNERIGLLYELEPYIKNGKLDTKNKFSLQNYNYWVSLLEWTLYFFRQSLLQKNS